MAIVGEKLHLDRKRLITLLKMWNQTKSKMHLTGVRKKLQEMMKKFADEKTKQRVFLKTIFRGDATS